MKHERITATVDLDVAYTVEKPYKGMRDPLTGEPLEPDFGGSIQVLSATVAWSDSRTMDNIEHAIQEIEDLK